MKVGCHPATARATPRREAVHKVTGKAREMPGELTVLFPEDTPQSLFNCAGDVPSPLSIRDEKMLTDHPRCVGDRIAAVAATSRAICRVALEAIKVEYEQLPAVLGIREALRGDAPLVHPEISTSNAFKKIEASQGYLHAGFLESDHVFEEKLHNPAVHHACLDPPVVSAALNAKEI